MSSPYPAPPDKFLVGAVLVAPLDRRAPLMMRQGRLAANHAVRLSEPVDVLRAERFPRSAASSPLESRPLQALDDAPGDDRRHAFVAVPARLPASLPQKNPLARLTPRLPLASRVLGVRVASFSSLRGALSCRDTRRAPEWRRSQAQRGRSSTPPPAIKYRDRSHRDAGWHYTASAARRPLAFAHKPTRRSTRR